MNYGTVLCKHEKKLKKDIGTDLLSVQVSDSSYFHNFTSKAEFEKWAAAEVADFDIVPVEMEIFVLPGGLDEIFYPELQNNYHLLQLKTFERIIL